MPEQDLYSILGIAKSASPAEIKKAYRALARKLHPDKNPGDKTAEDRFKKASYAHEVLSDPKKRELYDEFGEAGLKEGFDPRMYRAWSQGGSAGGASGFGGGNGFSFNMEDLFGGGGGRGVGDFVDFFSQGGRGGQGQNLESEITISLIEALKGTQRELEVHGGSGKSRKLTVKVPAGVKEGSVIRVRGQGGSGRGKAGDILLTIHVAPHPWLQRDGNDLVIDLPVTIVEGWLGAKVRVPTLEGEVMLRIPPRTQSGTKLRIRGKGAPVAKDQRGDLVYRVSLHFPTGNVPELDDVMQKLAAHGGDDLRSHLTLT